MRLQNTAHTSRPWRIHEITRDFRLEDVWTLPGSGGPDGFPEALRRFASSDPSRSSSGVVHALFSIRRTIGRLLGWDGAHAVMHIGWVAGPDGAHHAQMAVYAKPNGLLGSAYMAAINPIRRLIVYPRMTAGA